MYFINIPQMGSLEDMHTVPNEFSQEDERKGSMPFRAGVPQQTKRGVEKGGGLNMAESCQSLVC